MQGEILPGCLAVYTKIAEQCLQSRSKKRPTMAEVVVRLESALVFQEGNDSVTDEEMFNDSGDSDNQENAETDAIDENAHGDIGSGNGWGEGHQDMQTLSEGGMVRLESALVLQEGNNSLTDEAMFNDSGDSDNQENAEKDAMDANAQGDSGRGNGRGGGNQDMQTLREASGGSPYMHATKLTFKMKLMKIFFAAAVNIGTARKILSPCQLCKTLGYCLEDKEFLLVYEYMENGCLANHLYGRPFGVEPLSWFRRIKILLGAAQGLAFLHKTMKVSSNKQFGTHNILLDQEFNSKLSYFGLEPAYKFPVFPSSYATLSDRHPNAPPETHCGEYDMMSDVYEFGVVLLET